MGISIARNEIHVRTVKCYEYVQAHPELKTTFRPGLYEALEKLAKKVGPALKTLEGVDTHDDQALAKAVEVLDASHDMIIHLHEGAKYRFHKHTDQLKELVPLRVGDTPAEDGVRLHTLARVLPTLVPAYPWLPDDGLTLAALKKQIVAHEEAAPIEAAAGGELRDALKLLRDERANAHRLWDNEKGERLEAWVVANVPPADVYTAGLERRKRPRPLSEEQKKAAAERRAKRAQQEQQPPPAAGGADTTTSSGTVGSAPSGSEPPAADGAPSEAAQKSA